ncbi:MAG: UvrB/UvrC motif-containing protein [Candidatus Magasanikbacteria bacterium]
MKNKKEEIKNLPNKPGIYLFYSDGELIYVGKASSLKNRVKSYFQQSDKKEKTAREVIRPIEEMIEQVDDIEFKETDSALEAIILEAEYIKKHQPKYNVLGKDNKSWNYIAITAHKYPSVDTVRQHQYKNMEPEEREQKFEEVFGPYPKLNTKATLKILRKLFNYSTCQTKDRPEGKPCLYYQMGKCLGVCTNEISPKEYRNKVIKPLKKFLSGEKDELIDQLKETMNKASENKDYEEAARIRDQIEALNHIHDVALLNESFVEDALSINKLKIGRIEGYDISNLGKTGVVGSLVAFKNGEAQKNQYRKFKIRDVEGQSDVDSLKEVISRRVKYLGEKTDFAKEDPDLILVDGGKAQVNATREVLAQKEIEIPVLGIAKGENRDKNELIIHDLKPELIKWIKENKQTLVEVRDEAHRFALKYQKKIREDKLD